MMRRAVEILQGLNFRQCDLEERRYWQKRLFNDRDHLQAAVSKIDQILALALERNRFDISAESKEWIQEIEGLLSVIDDTLIRLEVASCEAKDGEQ